MKNSIFKITALLLFLFIGQGTVTAQNYIPQTGDVITTDNGKYIVKGANLILNPSFDSGLDNWTAGDGTALSSDNFSVVSSGGADGGAYITALGGGSSKGNKSILSGWAIESGKSYLFSCWALRTTSGMSSNTQYSKVFQSDTQTGTDTQIGTLSYTAATWTQTQIVFTASKSYCVAGFGWLNAATSFDYFFLGEVELSNELVTEKLSALITEATTLYSSTVQGDNIGEYKSDVRSTFMAAIEAAQNLLNSATTQAQINDSYTTLSTAITTYKNSVNPPFIVGQKYQIVHRASGLLLTSAGSSGNLITISAEADSSNAQIFTFEAAPQGASATGYNLKDADGNYIYRSGSWNTFSGSTTLTEANAIFNVVTDGDYVQLKNMGSGSVLGTDGSSDGAGVYSNKNGAGVAKFDWTLKVYIPLNERDDKYYFDIQLEKAQTLLKGIDTTLISDEPFHYSLSAYNTYKEALAAAVASSNYKQATQDLKDAMSVFSANYINKPDESKKYSIIQSSGMSLTCYAGDTYARVGSQAGSAGQQFTFVATGSNNAYYIKESANGKYLCKSTASGWDTLWGDDNSGSESQWVLAPLSGGYFSLTNFAGKGCLGSDATTDSALVYCDKSSSAVNSQWIVSVYSLTAALEKQIAAAQTLIATTTVGTASDQVPQSAIDALSAAIATAQTALSTVTTFAEASAATTAMQEAIASFKKSYNPIKPFDTSLTYNMVHYSGNYLTVTTTTGDATITSPAGEGADGSLQEITLISVPCDTLDMLYKIKKSNEESYLAVSGTYNTVWQSRGDTVAAIFQAIQMEGKYFALKGIANYRFLGTDGNTSGSAVYSDKRGTTTTCYWYLQSAAKDTLNKKLFASAIDSAQALAAGMVQGYKQGEYFLSDIKAFADTIATAQALYTSSRDQAVVDAACEQLLNAILIYKAKAHTHDVSIADYLNDLIPIYQAECDAIVPGTQKGDYPASAKEAYNTAIATARTATPDAAALQALLSARTAFFASVITVDRSALTAAIATVQGVIGKAVAGDCNGQYPQSAIDSYKSALATAQTACDNNTLTQAQIDAALQALKDAGTTFTSTKVAIDFTALKAAITLAGSAITDATPEKGEGPGTYPEAAFTTLQGVIDASTAMNGSNSVNQTTVNGQTTALTQAIATFKASRTPNDYSELENLLAQAQALYNSTPTGSDTGMADAEAHETLLASITKNKAALSSTSQTDINKAVKLLKRDIQLFKNSITGIETLTLQQLSIIGGKGVLNLANLPQGSRLYIYALNGALVQSGECSGSSTTHLAGGIYTVVIKTDKESRQMNVLIK